jgi:ribosomal protein S27AE
MSNQIEKDKNKLLSFAEIFDGDNEYQSACDDIRDIASRLGKLDGWKDDGPCYTNQNMVCYFAYHRGRRYSIDSHLIHDSIPDEPKPETPANGKWVLDSEDENLWKHEKCGCLWYFTEGDPLENRTYFCPRCGERMIEAGKPDKWRE